MFDFETPFYKGNTCGLSIYGFENVDKQKYVQPRSNFENNNNTAAPQIRARFFVKIDAVIPAIAVKIIVIFAVLRYNVKSVFCARIKNLRIFLIEFLLYVPVTVLSGGSL